MKKPISAETRAQIRIRAARGETLKTITAACGVSMLTAARIINAAREERARGMAHAEAGSNY